MEKNLKHEIFYCFNHNEAKIAESTCSQGCQMKPIGFTEDTNLMVKEQ